MVKNSLQQMALGKNLGEKKVKVLVTQTWPTLATTWTIAWQIPLSMDCSKQEYWSGAIPFSRKNQVSTYKRTSCTPLLHITQKLTQNGSKT